MVFARKRAEELPAVELAYYDSVVHRFNHYTTKTPSLMRLLLAYLNSPTEWLETWVSRKQILDRCVFLNNEV